MTTRELIPGMSVMARSPSFTPVRSGLLQRKCACGGTPGPSGECEECRKKKLQRKTRNSELEARNDSDVPPIVHEVLRSHGQPLDADTRSFMESRFGHDFSRVRVHSDSRAAASARAVNALAYTAGGDVVFAEGQYAPRSTSGQRLLTHELTHVVQQRNSADMPTSGEISLGRADSLQESEADSASKNLGIPAARTAIRQLQRKTWDTLPVYEERPEIIAQGECEEFPGGSTECEVDPKTGTPTGKVTHRVDEKNPCTKPCVEQHEAVHVKQLKRLCPGLRDCYLAADKGKRPALDCAKMAIFGTKDRECEAYKVSVPCVERRLANARACQSKENKAYGARKLASEKCFRDKNCGS